MPIISDKIRHWERGPWGRMPSSIRIRIPCSLSFLVPIFLLISWQFLPLLHAQNSGATLLEVRPDNASGTIRLICDGAFDFVRSEDGDPSRVVVDLPGVKNGLKQKVSFRSDLVKEISVGPLAGNAKRTTFRRNLSGI